MHGMNSTARIIAAANLKPLTTAACKRLRNGDIVGTYFTGANFEGFWDQARVIANDTRDGILVVQHGHAPMESFWYSEGDDIIRWPNA